VDPNGQSPVLPPYILDYETGGKAKLTPNSGKYGQSGSSGSNNQIVGHYTHTWAVHIPNGDNGMADDVAKDHGFVNLGKVSKRRYFSLNIFYLSLGIKIKYQDVMVS